MLTGHIEGSIFKYESRFGPGPEANDNNHMLKRGPAGHRSTPVGGRLRRTV